MKVYWISAYRNSSQKPEIHIHYLKNPDRLDVTLICVCMISQKTIQYMPDYEIMDILESFRFNHAYDRPVAFGQPEV